ncbi:hypothetical protein FOA52_001905 [Chlamydomonas sp. UWO 241]|nr:hypothetical protein FOA52_001905 [Chlamydomonas sp. UWO 241]
MASPVPPDGPPPVRAPDDNPASPMLVDDDVELVPPPAEESKKRNAFDLMKASNLKAASQAKQLKKAKHAAAAPAAPAQAPEHPPREDVPPATPTATPAADGPTIDATPIATSVKKKPTSSEAQKSSDSLMVPNIILLMNVYYVMALHIAEVERGFSIHRILKNRLRSRLMILMVDSLLRIWHLAQSFTGPRESENNSLINEAAEKMSGASLQSQGVIPPAS